MRLKKEITRLAEQAKVVEFPSPPKGFQRFRDDLYAVIHENCGYDIARTLEYDEYEEAFYVTVNRSGIPLAIRERTEPQDDFNMVLTKMIDIDPKGDIAAKVDEINKVAHHLNMTHNLLAVMLEKQRQGYKMVDLTEAS